MRTLFLTLLCFVCSQSVEAQSSRLARAFDSLQKEAATAESDSNTAEEDLPSPPTGSDATQWKTATFANGCFWCTEAVFQELHGVRNVVSGYTGGRVPYPSYEQVCTGLTGHAEAIQLQYDPDKITYAKLLEVFWRTHDPTTPNRQGPDIGTQYRSGVFYHDKEQMELARHFKQSLNEAHAFRKPVVTEITKYQVFYPAERKHQNYYSLNRRAGYCKQVIGPKLSKFRRVFKDELARNPKNRRSPEPSNE